MTTSHVDKVSPTKNLVFRPGTIAAGRLLDDSPSTVFLPSAFGYLNVEKLDDVHCNYADASLHSMGGSLVLAKSFIVWCIFILRNW